MSSLNTLVLLSSLITLIFFRGGDSIHSTRSKHKPKKSAVESSTTHSTMSSTKMERVGEVFGNEAKEAMRRFVHDVTHKGVHERRFCPLSHISNFIKT